MSAIILDGRYLAQLKRKKLKQVLMMKRVSLGLRLPGLAMILVGEDPASQIYVQKKSQACRALGYLTEIHAFPCTVSEDAVLACIQALNDRDEIDGILIQLPLPPSIDTVKVLDAVWIEKDVDGFHPYHTGLLSQNRPRLRPCTPYGIMALLAYYQIPLSGAVAVVVGASNTVGRPMALELLNAQATVTVCHRATRDLDQAIRSADILIVATGVMDVFDSCLIKQGAVVVDVGIHRLKNGQLRGDILFEQASKRASFITPVPGGVGPMTVISVLYNTYASMIWREQSQEVEDLASDFE